MNIEEMKKLARKEAKRIGLANLTRDGMCRIAGIADGSFKFATGVTFTSMVEDLKKEGVGIGPQYKITKGMVDADLRKGQILGIAVELAKKSSYMKVRRSEIARQADIADATVSKYFNTMTQLRRDIMRVAIRDNILEIIAQGLVERDKHAQKATQEQRTAAAKLIATF